MAHIFGHKIHILILNLAKIHIFNPKSAYGGGRAGIIPEQKLFFLLFPNPSDL